MSLTEQREGIEAGRLDMFVDGAFAFILTLLLIGGESIPDSTDKLLHALGGIPAFAICFFQIAFFWHGHVRWRKRCHSADASGRWLSLLLVFFAMIFVYPLHMVFSGVFAWLSGGYLPSNFVVQAPSDMRTLFTCYGLAYACMAGTLTLLFRDAAKVAMRRGLDSLGARREMQIWSVPAVIGLLSALVALLMPLSVPGWMWSIPGMIYWLLFLIGPVTDRFDRCHPQA
ncbi:TMEM175 family protein [Rhodanobacter sp. AS-Z3]|uniref:TMEM175 family protein n=1 Tax=Rhodanobacter sp. AS-Z3 TaxID=3031330 RepID=UPI00247AF760|nr:TMEM175 family protein [Rhodanobacter sp. AS-Z3]WEN15259.1 TMEM175 family protein [Rhodanobacter sp. AS-Z3]